MKLVSILSLVLIVSCGTKNELDTPAPQALAGTPELVAFDDTLDVGNFVEFVSPKIVQITSGENCSYSVRTRVDITNSDHISNTIELKIRKNDRAHRRNSRNCPESFGLNENTTKSYSYSSLANTYSERRRESLDAEFFCLKNTWCKRAELYKQRETFYEGIKVDYTEFRIVNKNGRVYKRISWVAKDNLFLNTIAFQLKTWNGSQLLDYRRATKFSVKNH